MKAALLPLAAALSLAPLAQGAETAAHGCDHPALNLAPYAWKQKGPTAEATMPGAYVKAAFRGSATVGLIVDGATNRGCPATSMPVVEFSVDNGPYQVVPLTRTDGTYTLPLGERLTTAEPHRVEVYFRAADLTQDRWTSSRTHLQIAGLALDADGTLLPWPKCRKRAIGFGDSITEGVGGDGLFTSWQSLAVNNARATWLPIVCAALDCEYGQLGSGGLGMVRALNLPPLPQVWDHYDASTSRLTGGRLLPEPDYVFCALGTNDYEKDITADYTNWLAAVRKACPDARVFCVVPPLGVHREEVRAAVGGRRKAGDVQVHLIDTAPLQDGFRGGAKPTRLAFDGAHPTVFGQALLASLIAVEAQKVLDQGARP
ncbi:MAG: GDSL-type esterase/lipase family protein [Isosphaeraceae bacterium]|nr:GDSL-type esterase/lipase family protein [Isosphaeraceae bacterium]